MFNNDFDKQFNVAFKLHIVGVVCFFMFVVGTIMYAASSASDLMEECKREKRAVIRDCTNDGKKLYQCKAELAEYIDELGC